MMEISFMHRVPLEAPSACHMQLALFQGALPCVDSEMTDAGGARALRKTPSRTRGQTKKTKGVRNAHVACLAVALSTVQAGKS